MKSTILTLTLEEVIALVPLGYRGTLAPPLRDLATLAHKMCAARNAVASLETHKAKGTFPPDLSQKQPTLQLSKEFGDTDEGRAVQQRLSTDFNSWLVKLLDLRLKAKKDEMDDLLGRLQPAKVRSKHFCAIYHR